MKLAILGAGKIVNDMLNMLSRTGMEKVCILGRKEHHEKAE